MRPVYRVVLSMASASVIIGAAPIAGSPDIAALTIDGAIPAPLNLSLADLDRLPATTVGLNIHGKSLNCDGPRLVDVLIRAGLPNGNAVRGAALQLVVVATGADGYRAAFTLGELERTLGNASIIVSARCNGAALDTSNGPLRLIAAGDQRGARSVRQLVRLSVVQLAADAR